MLNIKNIEINYMFLISRLAQKKDLFNPLSSSNQNVSFTERGPSESFLLLVNNTCSID